MNSKPPLNYGDVIRLKKDLQNTNFKAGDYGIVWAVYHYLSEENNEELVDDYEGSFWDKNSNYGDSMFEEDDAEKVIDINGAPFSAEMKSFRLFLTQKEK